MFNMRMLEILQGRARQILYATISKQYTVQLSQALQPFNYLHCLLALWSITVEDSQCQPSDSVMGERRAAVSKGENKYAKNPDSDSGLLPSGNRLV